MVVVGIALGSWEAARDARHQEALEARLLSVRRLAAGTTSLNLPWLGETSRGVDDPAADLELFAATAKTGAGTGRADLGDGEAGAVAGEAETPPAEAVEADYYQLLLDSQRSTGAITMKPGAGRIVPYFANLAAMALLDKDPGRVRAYLEWYLGRLNRPDKYGMHGTIYDYRVDQDGLERPTGVYDSADSYSATLLTLLGAYFERTRDHEFLLAHLPEIQLVASVITGLQDADGLVWAKPNRAEKYLMDNCENFRGMMDYAAILDAIGRRQEAEEARRAAGRILAGVETRLWNADRGSYDWGIYTLRVGQFTVAEVSRPSNLAAWYPDATGQIFPIVFGLLDPADPRAATLYEGLAAWHPGWVNQVKEDPHPWSILGYTAALMGDVDRAAAFTEATERVYLANEGPFSGLSWELAFYLRTVDLITGLTGTAGPGEPGP